MRMPPVAVGALVLLLMPGPAIGHPGDHPVLGFMSAPVTATDISATFLEEYSSVDPQDGLHGGADLACTIGTPVQAAMAGIVKYAYGRDEGTGNTRNQVILYHGIVGALASLHTYTVYYHLQGDDITDTLLAGEEVAEGQVIGYAGGDGHVHMGMHLASQELPLLGSYPTFHYSPTTRVNPLSHGLGRLDGGPKPEEGEQCWWPSDPSCSFVAEPGEGMWCGGDPRLQGTKINGVYRLVLGQQNYGGDFVFCETLSLDHYADYTYTMLYPFARASVDAPIIYRLSWGNCWAGLSTARWHVITAQDVALHSYDCQTVVFAVDRDLTDFEAYEDTGSIRVSWHAYNFDYATTFKLYRSNDGGVSYPEPPVSQFVFYGDGSGYDSAYVYRDTAVVYDGCYSYRLRDSETGGYWGPARGTFTQGQTPPAPAQPVVGRVVPDDDSLRIHLLPTGDYVNGFRVYYSTSGPPTEWSSWQDPLACFDSSVSISTVVPGQDYYVGVIADGAGGSSPMSEAVRARAIGRPSEIAVSGRVEALRVSWNPSEGATFHKILLNSHPTWGPWLEDSTGTDSLHYVFELDSDSAYYVCVVGVDDWGNSTKPQKPGPAAVPTRAPFKSTMEAAIGHPGPLLDSVESATGVTGVTSEMVATPDSPARPFWGSNSLRIACTDGNPSTDSHCRWKIFAGVDYDPGDYAEDGAILSYHVFVDSAPGGRGRVGIDARTASGSLLSDFVGWDQQPLLLDQYGVPVRSSARAVPVGDWYRFVIPLNVPGLSWQTIKDIYVTYDDSLPEETGRLVAYIDDVMFLTAPPHVDISKCSLSVEGTPAMLCPAADGDSALELTAHVVDYTGEPISQYLMSEIYLLAETDTGSHFFCHAPVEKDTAATHLYAVTDTPRPGTIQNPYTWGGIAHFYNRIFRETGGGGTLRLTPYVGGRPGPARSVLVRGPDFNASGTVNFSDTFKYTYYMSVNDLRGDLNFSGEVNFVDTFRYIPHLTGACGCE